jgi:hypothetical protein
MLLTGLFYNTESTRAVTDLQTLQVLQVCEYAYEQFHVNIGLTSKLSP